MIEMVFTSDVSGATVDSILHNPDSYSYPTSEGITKDDLFIIFTNSKIRVQISGVTKNNLESETESNIIHEIPCTYIETNDG